MAVRKLLRDSINRYWSYGGDDNHPIKNQMAKFEDRLWLGRGLHVFESLAEAVFVWI